MRSETLSPTDLGPTGERRTPPEAQALEPSEGVHPEEPGTRRWSDWAPAGVTPWTVGVEEEVMLLDPTDWSLASEADAVMAKLTGELATHTSTETHGSALELRTDPHEHVGEGLSQLESLRGELAAELAARDLKGARG